MRCPPPSHETARAGPSFILSCDCASIADREPIAADARKPGAPILDIYTGFAGIAVASPAGTCPAALTVTLDGVSVGQIEATDFVFA